MTWRYVIMANGGGLRWGNHLGIPKHLITIADETLLQRITRQVLKFDPGAEVVISSADPRCVADGARRHVPERNELEIDRFVPELVTDRVCFLYGDTYYTDETISRIVEKSPQGLHFFESETAIVALKSDEPALLLHHVAKVRDDYTAGAIDQCKGWDVLRSFSEAHVDPERIRTHVHDGACDFNTPADLSSFTDRRRDASTYCDNAPACSSYR